MADHTIANRAAPIAPAERIDTLDVLRGVAICGILLMNIPWMGLSWNLGHPPFPAVPDRDWIAYSVQSLLFEGTMRGLFTLLFGAGMLLMLRRVEVDGLAAPVEAWVRRCCALLLLAIVQFGLLLWPGEILFNYGITGLFLLPFRRIRPRWLIAIAACLLTLHAVHDGIDSAHEAAVVRAGDAALAAPLPRSPQQERRIIARAEVLSGIEPTAESLAEEREQRLHFPSVWRWSVENWAYYNVEFNAWPSILESLGFMLVGMALFRAGILTGQRRTGFYAGLAAGGYAIGLALRGVALWLDWRAGFHIDPTATTYHGIVYEPARLAMTIGNVGAVIALLKAGWIGRAAPLKALGRMALTTYLLQSLVTAILFYALGYYEAFGFATLMGVAALIWVVTAAFAMWWLRRHAMGPVERLLRIMAYGRPAVAG
ncbi:DUF418 domain-containing protein [Sphingomonas naphthae]|uniref:DUF418 domain-containing protein n=1 Tax=Sphingomonas naphthae TaxID=1813468 RepID=A0ABY7TGZ9_9SPHN|nr:DUF418 domain-containing protein [Sphingomonas naphthae]WCT72502.1 DUF418 domain-containing protein [Sphingomonas naphthae]